MAELGRDLRAWRKLKGGALHGWFKCTDARLYHWVVAEVVAEAWERRRSASKKGLKGASSKWGNAALDARNKQTRSQRLAQARVIATHCEEEWIALVDICGRRCAKCQSDTDELVKDHITPIYQGGSDGIENLQPLCRRCNASKGPERLDHRENDWAERLAERLTLAGIPVKERLAECLAECMSTSGKGQGQGQGQNKNPSGFPAQDAGKGEDSATRGSRASGSNPRANGTSPRQLGTNPRAIKNLSLEMWRKTCLSIDTTKDVQGLTWQTVTDALADPKADRAIEAAGGHRTIADRSQFNQGALESRFRTAYEQLLEHPGAVA